MGPPFQKESQACDDRVKRQGAKMQNKPVQLGTFKVQLKAIAQG
jgi:hypothetical protein